MKETIIENKSEKSLTKKSETALRIKNKEMLPKVFKTTAGVLFYTATFVLSMAVGYTFIFSLFLNN